MAGILTHEQKQLAFRLHARGWRLVDRGVPDGALGVVAPPVAGLRQRLQHRHGGDPGAAAFGQAQHLAGGGAGRELGAQLRSSGLFGPARSARRPASAVVRGRWCVPPPMLIRWLPSAAHIGSWRAGQPVPRRTVAWGPRGIRSTTAGLASTARPDRLSEDDGVEVAIPGSVQSDSRRSDEYRSPTHAAHH